MANTKRRVGCKNCGEEWESTAKPENLKCKSCGSTDIADNVQVPTCPPPLAPIKSKEQLEHEADVANKKLVDAGNKAAAAELAKAEAKLATTPLNDEERAFIERCAPLMNEGRAISQPSPAEIQRYSQLIKRKDII